MDSQGSSRIEASKILVWGHIGQELKELDPERVLAIAQQNPNYYLALLSNKEIQSIITEIYESGKGLTEEHKKLIRAWNKNQAVFIEVAKFLHATEDMLSTGSFLTGELEGEQAILRLLEERD